MKRNPLPKYEKDEERFGDPVLAEFMKEEEDRSTLWYDFLHLDWKEIVALVLVAIWLFYCVYSYN